MIFWGKDHFEAAGQFTARQQHPMATGAAFEANICAQTGHIPLVPAAGVRFTQAKDVVQLQVR
jgi:hypothetical protein